MKATAWMLRLFTYKNDSGLRKKRQPIFENLAFRHKFDVNYAGDNLDRHCFDIYYANEENRKHKLIVDIHGGAYIMSHRKDNLHFGLSFLEQGYDFVTLDYRVNRGHLTIADQAGDLAQAIRYIQKHSQELDIYEDEIYLTGDSAGGHLALLFAILSENQRLQEELDLNIAHFKPKAVLVNCPVFDYCGASLRHTGTRGAQKLIYGPRYLDFDFLNRYSPSSYINDLTLPVFCSTCKLDFIRQESLALQKALSERGDFEFIDIDSDDPKIGHVHNILLPEREESIRVNNAMMAFIEKY